ncbi:YceI family protein [Kallotenue papyrolyticum]|uniref:YceI family protein n=1 Tax=Kallotenue papyrolyticum TaxID=1325125 RepID=UPI000492303E|nr:YceI family protein [Kallotenue papyrolyticum]
MAWQIDTAHSEILFSVRHMMISTVRGKFRQFSGTVEGDERNPTAAKVYVEIDAASIDTGNADRDQHLRSADFLNVERYPKITFKSTRIEQLDDQHFKLHGDLTIRDVTRPVVLDVEYAGMAKSPWGTFSAGFSAHTKIKRSDWGLSWNVALETGGWLVSDEIKVDIELELIKQPEQAQSEAQAEAASLHNA